MMAIGALTATLGTEVFRRQRTHKGSLKFLLALTTGSSCRGSLVI